MTPLNLDNPLFKYATLYMYPEQQINMLKKKSLSTRELIWGIVSLVIGVIGLLGSLFLVGTQIIYRTKATPPPVPQEIKLTNFSPNSISVSFITAEPTVGSVAFSTNVNMKDTQTAFDDRVEFTSSILHHITLKNLAPDTVYFFRLISGGQQFDNNGNSYAFSTPGSFKTPPGPPFIIKGQTDKEALIYFSFPDSTSISAPTDKNGRYLLTLNNTLKKDLKGFYPIQRKETGYLLINDGKVSLTKPIVVEDEMTVMEKEFEETSQDAKPKTLAQELPKPSPVKATANNVIEQILVIIRRLFSKNA